MLDNCYVDIHVDENSEGVKFLKKRHPHLVSQYMLSPEQALSWLRKVIIPIGIDYVTYIDRGYGLGMGRMRPILDEDGPSSGWAIPPLMEEFIYSFPLVIYEILKEQWLAGVDVFPLCVFRSEDDTAEVRLVAYPKDEE